MAFEEHLVSVRWIVSGRVQGVGFRWFVFQRAQALGLRGWVSNLPDGRVDVCACGSRDALKAMEEALQRGPMAAAVDAVEKRDITPQITSTKTFYIR